MARTLQSLVIFCFLWKAFGYEENWESLQKRKMPEWFDRHKVGLLLSWGVHSVPAYRSEFFWKRWKQGNQEESQFMSRHYRPKFTYPEFSLGLRAQALDPDVWARVLRSSEAKYVLCTAKHYDGYTMWPSSYSWIWNSRDLGFNTDMLANVSNIIRDKANLTFGIAYAFPEFFNRMYLEDKAKNFATSEYVDMKLIPELKELVTTYLPDIIMPLHDDQDLGSKYWKSTEFLAWLFTKSAIKDKVVVADAWNKLGSYKVLRKPPAFTSLPPYKWERVINLIRNSESYVRDARAHDYIPTNELIREIVQTISMGGNVVFAFGPCADGSIDYLYQEQLEEIGTWLKDNKDAIFNTVPLNTPTGNPDIWFTSNVDKGITYLIILKWPKSNVLKLKFPSKMKGEVRMLGFRYGKIKYVEENGILKLTLPSVFYTYLPSRFAWVLEFGRNPKPKPKPSQIHTENITVKG